MTTGLLGTATAVVNDIQSGSKVCIHVVRPARGDVRALRAATALREAGFIVSIIDVESDLSRPAEEMISGVLVKHIAMHSWYSSRRFQAWFFVKAVQTFILSIIHLIKCRADIYHASEVTALPACWVVALIYRRPLVFEAYELPLPETSIVFWHRLRGLLTRFLAIVLPRCAGVIAVSPPIVEEMRNRYRIPVVTLIRNTPPYQSIEKTDHLRQHLGLSPKVRIALYQGNLQPDRGLPLLIHAAPFLNSGTVIVMMGKDMVGTQTQLEALVNSIEVTERVKIIPPVPQEHLLHWTASADIGLIVYARDYSQNTQMMLPNKLFEYLMVGLPVLASQLDATAEVISAYNVGRVLSSLAPADIGAAINAMLTDEIALARMRHNALEVSKHTFCWEQESPKLVRLYNEIQSRRCIHETAIY